MRETWWRPKPKPAKEQREAIEKNLRRIDTLFDDAAD